MAKDPRHTVISLRVTTEEHDKLRAVATARGLSISDLIRSLVDRETAPPPPPTETISAVRSVGARSVFIDHGDDCGTGIFWQPVDGATTEGATLTLSRTRLP